MSDNFELSRNMPKSIGYIVLNCLVCALLSSCSAYQTAKIPHDYVLTDAGPTAEPKTLHREPYQLIWSDEFDGQDLNTANWGFETGPSWYNKEQQAYTDQNAFVKEGKLVIEARIENYPEAISPERYTSSRLLSQGKQSWKYGLFEARIKRPSGVGVFPAFWMMGNSYDKEKGNWPACGEVGIVEFLHTEDVDTWSSAITNLHYGKTFAEHKSLDSLATAPQFEQVTDAYHTYSFEWTATTMAWYLDGQLQAPGKIAYTELPDYDDEFNHQEFFLLLSFAVGFDMFDGKLIGDPSKSTWPKKLQVDWVRVYQKD